ncbi:MAG: potassium transporter Kup [Bdellovibrionales bacterium RIFOXYD1_FULL_53_11]|nr:MAG: potassium transporter Kup [Bdellovibrionales bacterium RIFOXYD1_FULL_53_11]
MTLALGALGVVYGDIGTSPLYAIKESLHPGHGVGTGPEAVLGIISLVFWALTMIVCFKYLTFILRADNKGEGGMMALLALLAPQQDRHKHGTTRTLSMIVIWLGLFGTGLLFGEGIITPAISVLSALEGLEVATPAFKPLVMPLTIAILVALFMVQKRGTASIGAVFGPTMLLWFLAIGLAGLPQVLSHPGILQALNPTHAFSFLAAHGIKGFFILSAVVLCITGAEALYADLGHFGRKPITIGWYAVVYPSLIINYLGQGALVMSGSKEALANPFYALVSGHPLLLYPMVVLATLATVIASQALISGVFSLVQQGMQLGYLPRMLIRHTSRTKEGQIYVPAANLLLMISCILLVAVFRESSRLAAAYGIAVTGTMTISSILFFLVATRKWGWALYKTVPLVAIFLLIDLLFFGANLTKIFHGGAIPVIIAAFMFTLMATWHHGRWQIARIARGRAVAFEKFYEQIVKDNLPRAKGTAVFMTHNRETAPLVLLRHYTHNQILHEHVILLTIITEDIPDVPAAEKVRVTELEHGFVRLTARYGYMESPDVREILEISEGSGLSFDHDRITYYLGRDTLLEGGDSTFSAWRKKLFILLSKNSRPALEFFNLPPDKVMEIGSQYHV